MVKVCISDIQHDPNKWNYNIEFIAAEKNDFKNLFYLNDQPSNLHLHIVDKTTFHHREFNILVL